MKIVVVDSRSGSLTYRSWPAAARDIGVCPTPRPESLRKLGGTLTVSFSDGRHVTVARET